MSQRHGEGAIGRPLRELIRPCRTPQLASLRENSNATPLGLKPAIKECTDRSGNPLRHPKSDFFRRLFSQAMRGAAKLVRPSVSEF
jgi:hypothetical protein